MQKAFRDFAWQKKKGERQRQWQRYIPPCNNCNGATCRLESVSSSGINSSDKRMHKRRRNGRGVITTSSRGWKEGAGQSGGVMGVQERLHKADRNSVWRGGHTEVQRCVGGRQSEGDSGVHFVSAAPPNSSLHLPHLPPAAPPAN